MSESKTELYSEEELEERNENHKVLKEFSWKVKSFLSLEIISETEEVSTELESEVSTKIEGWKEEFELSRSNAEVSRWSLH